MCTRPLELTYYSQYLRRNVTTVVACGKCPECLEKYQNDWALRLSYESKRWKYVYFLTLTYKQDALDWVNIGQGDIEYIRSRLAKMPASSDLVRARSRKVYGEYLRPDFNENDVVVPVINRVHFTNWFKRCRIRAQREYGKERGEMKYFGCSEYGPLTLRPHFHLILFTSLTPWEVNDCFVADWQGKFGKVDWKKKPIEISADNPASNVMSYVAKYCSKPDFIENPYVVAGCIPKTFRMISKGLGSNMCEHHFHGFNFMKFQEYLINYKYYGTSCRDYEFDFLPQRFAKYSNGKFGWQGHLYGFNSDFLDYVIDRLYHVYQRNAKTGKIYKIPIPRYIRDKGFSCFKTSERVKVRTFTGKISDVGFPSVTSVVCNVNTPITESYIQLAIKERLLLRSIELYNRQFRELQAHYGARQDDANHLELLRSYEKALREREAKANGRLVAFYSKSKF